MIALGLEGRVPYALAHDLQQALVEHLAGTGDAVLLLLEHEETITVGRKRGAEAAVLAAGAVPVVTVERGGGATWHGPGQLVAYPIVDLGAGPIDLHRHLRALEEAVVDVLRGLGLEGVRDPRNAGVWLADPPGPPRKVCSVGVACRRNVTWHGLALNVDPDPAGFRRIRPCGFDAEVMTRLADHREPPPLASLVGPLAEALAHRLGRDRAVVRPVPLAAVEEALAAPDGVARLLAED